MNSIRTIFEGLHLEIGTIGSTTLINLYETNSKLKAYEMYFFIYGHDIVVDSKVGPIEKRYEILQHLEEQLKRDPRGHDYDYGFEYCFMKTKYPIMDMIKSTANIPKTKGRTGSKAEDRVRKSVSTPEFSYRDHRFNKYSSNILMSHTIPNYKLSLKFTLSDELDFVRRTLIYKLRFGTFNSGKIVCEGTGDEIIAALESKIHNINGKVDLFKNDWKKLLGEFYHDPKLVVKYLKEVGETRLLTELDYSKECVKLEELLRFDIYSDVRNLEIELEYNVGRREEIYEFIGVIEEIVNPHIDRVVLKLPNDVPSLKGLCGKLRTMVEYRDEKDGLYINYEDLSELGPVFSIEEMTSLLNRGMILYT